MIILFEEYLYSLAQIENLLSEKYYDDLKNSYCKINYVGYYFDASRHASPIIILYIQNSNRQKETFKTHTRKQFRTQLVQYLTDRFEFRKIIVMADIEQFVEQNFKKLQGKIYRPAGWKNELLLAVEKGSDLLEDFQNCSIESYELSV
ncbi:MAG: hypothetical protein U5M51_00685 [Emticicia sp.]|nr:hypothetical protein [Emticicia sp.]